MFTLFYCIKAVQGALGVARHAMLHFFGHRSTHGDIRGRPAPVDARSLSSSLRLYRQILEQLRVGQCLILGHRTRPLDPNRKQLLLAVEHDGDA